METNEIKADFLRLLKNLACELTEYICASDGKWKIKGFIDTDKKNL